MTRQATPHAACPFCGSDQLNVEDHLGTTIICCRECLSVGPVTAAQSQAQAWQRWNHRPRAAATVDDVACCRHLPHLPFDFDCEDFP
jgi:hypothetical protein